LDIELYKKALDREKRARKEAESLLEKKSLELYNTNKQLQEVITNTNLFPEENPNAVMRFSAHGRVLMYSNKHADAIIKFLNRPLSKKLKVYFTSELGYSFEKGVKHQFDMQIGKNTIRFDVVPFQPFDYINVYTADITDIKATEVSLQKLTESLKEAQQVSENFNKKLEIEVTERTKELSASEMKLKKSLLKEKELGELKTSFVSTASHQFRTPLAAIQSNSELLQIIAESLHEETSKRFGKITTRITSEIGKMTELMDDVLILGKLTAGKVDLKQQDINLVDFCIELAKDFNEIQSDGRIMEIVTNGKQYDVKLDPKLLTHSLSNLFSNAFKYSVGKNNPELIISFQSKEFVLTVKDYGIGIPKDELTKLFQPFFRANNVTEIKGTGLGLSIAKEYFEINKGAITAKSILGEGSSFEIKFTRQK
jgi:signal transduction histidine kinase